MKELSEQRHILRHTIGYVAAALSFFFLYKHINSLPIVAASLFFLVACVSDTHRTRIPNILILILLATGITLNVLDNGWGGLANSITGCLLGFGILLPFYLVGGFGAADVKALAAIGALTGPIDLLHIFVYIGLYGGVTALLFISLNKFATPAKTSRPHNPETEDSPEKSAWETAKTNSYRFPYAPSMALGYYTFISIGPFLI